MPYNPGVTDRSGELWGAGLLQASQGLASGIERWEKQREENKALTGQAKALETLLPAYAKSAGIAPEEIEKFLAPSADESPRARVARLSQAVEGIVGTAALKSKAQQDEAQKVQMQHIQSLIAGETQRQRAAAAETADTNAQRGRVRAMFGGSPSMDQLHAMIMQGDQAHQIMPAARPPATAGDAVRKMVAAGVDDPRMLAAIEKLAGTEQFQPSMVDLGDGITAMTTSRSSAVPVTKGAPKSVPGTNGVRTIKLPNDLGSIVVDATSGEPVKAANIVKPKSAAAKMDPIMVGTLTEQIQKLEAEKLEHEQEIVKGDKRFGFANLQARQGRVQEIDQQLAGLRATLAAGGNGGATTSAITETAPSAAADKKAVAATQTIYPHDAVQAELRRRKLIQ